MNLFDTSGGNRAFLTDANAQEMVHEMELGVEGRQLFFLEWADGRFALNFE